MQKSSRFNRLLALLVAIFMLVCCVPASVFAEDGAAEAAMVRMTFRFMEGENLVSKSDLVLPSGTHKFDELKNDVPDGYELAVSGDFMAEQGAVLDVPVSRIVKNVTMNIRFMDGEAFVAGGDYSLTEGVHNYSELTVPEGYKLLDSGDFMATEGAKLDVQVEKIVKNVVMNIRFMDGETFVVGGDYTFTEGVHNYSELTVPEGYKLLDSGDFMATEGAKLNVAVEKLVKDVVVNIRFMEGDAFVAGGDYMLPVGVQNYSVLAQYVPEGYVMAVSGDFMVTEGGKLEVPVEKISNQVVMNIRFMDGETFVAGGDYLLPVGVQNYSILAQYVPEGYVMAVSGDFMVTEGGKLDVPVEKISNLVNMHIRFMDGESCVAEGDYQLPAGDVCSK